MNSIVDRLAGFFGALRGVLAAPATGDAANGDVGKFVALLDGLDLHRRPRTYAHPARLPVCRHWPAALTAGSDATARLVGYLAQLEPHWTWTQNPNYRREPPSPEFLADYGYAAIVGPAGGAPVLIEHAALALGVLLLGPGTEYPAHRHPAVEAYVPLTPAEWQRDAGPWRREAPATIIHHPSNALHAMRAGPAPLLAVYLWHGDLATYARMAT